ncbi:unnamed protein product [Blepharisma stoltei]|uniref:polynucleotide adenylyltransferase n=1 Tax=Blepharisma stoltei TaxID=1481888 RepID=A0AAU9I814_9CILI|nr:unnamed protein product [Blepharisma stoltei]
MTASIEELSSSLHETLVSHKVFETAQGNQLRAQIISSLTQEFQAWCPQGKVIAFGSYKLGVHSPNTDLDILCIAPKNISRSEFQTEFYERLSSMNGVFYCHGVFRTKVPIIKLIIESTAVDLLYANVDAENLLDDAIFDVCDEATMLSLNGYRNNEILLRLVPDIEKYQMVLRAIKLWAKRKGLYSNIFGYLGGAAWSLMVAKVCMMYPGLSDVEIIYKFFKVYSVWDWSIPICLTPAEFHQKMDIYSTRSANDKSYISIMTPAFPRYNAAYTLSSSGFHLINQEVKLAYKITEDIFAGVATFDDLFAEIDFFQQFKYFLRVEIQSSTALDFENWHGLVSSRLKFLIADLECTYPKPRVLIYSRSFPSPTPKYPYSSAYYIGLNFKEMSSSTIDLRSPVSNFCQILNEQKPNPATMNIRIRFIPRNHLEPFIVKPILT